MSLYEMKDANLIFNMRRDLLVAIIMLFYNAIKIYITLLTTIIPTMIPRFLDPLYVFPSFPQLLAVC